MNKDEFQGGARYLGGKVEKGVGDAVGSREWQVDGVVDQVAGAAQNKYGKARSAVEDIVDGAPELAEEAKNRLQDAGRRSVDAADRGRQAVAKSVSDVPAVWAAAAAAGGYALAWLVHGRRA